jgi:hypothetical protein
MTFSWDDERGSHVTQSAKTGTDDVLVPYEPSSCMEEDAALTTEHALVGSTEEDMRMLLDTTSREDGSELISPRSPTPTVVSETPEILTGDGLVNRSSYQ